jgi:type IV pilus assembly protein PilA
MKKMNNKGFSLVELIIVIAIMAILVGVLAPQFIKYVEQSRESTDISSIDEVKKAVETYVADYNPGGTITVAADGTTISAGGGTSPAFDSSKQGEYGITSDSTKLKSKHSVITWTYDAEAFTWDTTYTASTTQPPYYNYKTGEKQ